MALYRTGGGRGRPNPTLLSCVTGEASYDAENTRELLTDWTDHPQRLWDVIDRTLAMGAEVVIHVGPRPNLIPATFTRLGNNVEPPPGQPLHADARPGRRLAAWAGTPGSPGSCRRGPSLLRAPFLTHVILEDWLLDQPLPADLGQPGRVAPAVEVLEPRGPADRPASACSRVSMVGGRTRTPYPRTRSMSQDLQDLEAQTFVETALKLGGKSEEEARKTGSLDRADEQVEALFATRYQTAHSPVHRAVWDRDFPGELFAPEPSPTPPGLRADDAGVARARPPPRRRPGPCSTSGARSPTRSSASWARSATGACWSTPSTAAGAPRSRPSPRS